jgi:hypothetical protein
MTKPAIYQAHIVSVLKLLDSIEKGQILMDGGTPYDAGTWFWAYDYQPANSVINALPAETSTLRARAVMKKLDTMGLIKGCHCGCRGSYTLSFLGKQILINKKQLPCLH